MERLTLQNRVNFLLEKGWHVTDQSGRFMTYQPPQSLGLPKTYFLELPKDDSKPGWKRYADGIIEILADIYNDSFAHFQIKLKQGGKSV